VRGAGHAAECARGAEGGTRPGAAPNCTAALAPEDAQVDAILAADALLQVRPHSSPALAVTHPLGLGLGHVMGHVP